MTSHSQLQPSCAPWRVQIIGQSAHVLDALNDTVTVFSPDDANFWHGVVEAVNSHASLNEQIELAQQKLEFAEFEWNRATEGMKKRDAANDALKARIEEMETALQKIADQPDHGNPQTPIKRTPRQIAIAALKGDA